MNAPLQLPLEQVLERCEERLHDQRIESSPLLSDLQLTQFVNTMFQFSDRTPMIRSAMTTPYRDIATLFDRTVETAKRGESIGCHESLDFALEMTDDLPTALWNLFLASRQFARWRDSEVISNLPNFTRQEKLERMKLWEHSLKAYKEPNAAGYQDTAGDTYYVWTHALARMIYDGLPARQSPLVEFYKTAFTHGSQVMGLSRKLGVISVFGTMSDHIPASLYGNAIGQLCADTVKLPHPLHESHDISENTLPTLQ